jgi:hypothetical protein
MKKIVLSLAALATLGFAEGTAVQNAPANETKIDETGFYAGLGISAMSSRDSSVSMDIFDVTYGQDRLGNINLIAGYMINDYLAVEGRYATTFTDEDRVELSSQWGLFVKPLYKFDDDDNRAAGDDYWAVYALLGYGNATLEGTNNAITDVDDGGFQWGIGLSYTFREHSDAEEYQYKDVWTIFFDYTFVGSDMDGYYYNGARKVDADAFTVGLTYKF